MREGVCGGECIVYIYKCVLRLGVGRKGTLLCLSYIKRTLAYKASVSQWREAAGSAACPISF